MAFTISPYQCAEFSQVKFDHADLRFTTKRDALYAIALGWPAEGRFLIKSLAENSPHYPGRISEGRTAWIQIRAQVGAGSAGTRDSGAERPAGKHAFSFRILAN